MKPAPFDYFAPTSVEETCALLARYGDNTKILERSPSSRCYLRASSN